MFDFLKDLNEIQRQAVECIDGPVMIIAGAGSGKTRALTYRVAYLIKKGVNPFNILALTFTNKAAREMKERIHGLVGSTEAMNVWMGTFHSVFAKILRFEGHRLGYPSNFTIYDEEDSRSLMKNIIKERNLDDKKYKFSYVLSRISSAKNNLLSPEDYAQNTEIMMQDKSSGLPEISILYNIYNKRLFKATAMDFDDLLFNMNVILRDFPEVLYKYQRKFHYVLVDEYQDTNYAQYLILKKLAANDENLCVVGDDAQSIYSFRGANIENILNFKKDYPDAHVFKLEQNYRSTQNIVNAANSIIAKNKKQIFKEIWTDNAEGNKIQLIKASTDTEEATMVANSIFETKMNNQLQNDAFAILYRTNAQSRSLEEALRKLNIPYRIYGGLSFYRRREIKDLLAYYRLAINNDDDSAFQRIINYPIRGIGKSTIEKLIVVANEAGKSMLEVINDISDQRTTINEKLGFNHGITSKLIGFATMIKSYSAQLKKKDAYELAKHIAYSSGIIRDLTEDKTAEGISRSENIEELINAIKEFTEAPRPNNIDIDLDYIDNPETPEDKLLITNNEQLTTNSEPEPEIVNFEQRITNNEQRTLDEFMQEVSLLTDADKDNKEDNNKVVLMTVHQAKGLEFQYVYVTGLEENLFPSMMSMSSREDIEEERRLFYVAVTRAEVKVTISHCQTRYRWGNITYCEPSRFLEEIDPRYIDVLVRKSTFQNNDSTSSYKRNYRTTNNEQRITNNDDRVSEPDINYQLKQHKNLKSLKDISIIGSTNSKQHKTDIEQRTTNNEQLTSNNEQLSTNNEFVASDTLNLTTGMEVEHQRFGKGKVITIEGKDANKKATVHFQSVGPKQLLLRFAKLKVL